MYKCRSTRLLPETPYVAVGGSQQSRHIYFLSSQSWWGQQGIVGSRPHFQEGARGRKADKTSVQVLGPAPWSGDCPAQTPTYARGSLPGVWGLLTQS